MKFEKIWKCQVDGMEMVVVTASGSSELLFRKIARTNKKIGLSASQVESMAIEEIRERLLSVRVEILSTSCVIADDKTGFP